MLGVAARAGMPVALPGARRRRRCRDRRVPDDQLAVHQTRQLPRGDAVGRRGERERQPATASQRRAGQRALAVAQPHAIEARAVQHGVAQRHRVRRELRAGSDCDGVCISVGRQQATLLRLIPVEPPEDAPPVVADFEYEPEPKDVLDALLPRYVEGQVYAAVLENAASEQAARMLAMRNASDNAADFIQDLTLTANKVRQATITTELMEIVAGATALEG